MAQDIYAPLHGMTVAIDKLSGTFRSCMTCSGKIAKIDTTPVGMHHGRLICCGCGAHTAYLGREHLAALLAAHNGADNGEAA
jgi:hypothetical protein